MTMDTCDRKILGRIQQQRRSTLVAIPGMKPPDWNNTQTTARLLSLVSSISADTCFRWSAVKLQQYTQIMAKLSPCIIKQHRVRAPSTHRVGPRANLDVLENKKILYQRGTEPEFLSCPDHSLVTIATELFHLFYNFVNLKSKIINSLIHGLSIY
jgi:hypothetical protein